MAHFESLVMVIDFYEKPFLLWKIAHVRINQKQTKLSFNLLECMIYIVYLNYISRQIMVVQYGIMISKPCLMRNQVFELTIVCLFTLFINPISQQWKLYMREAIRVHNILCTQILKV